MADYKKSLYNISLGGQGYLLEGTPTKPARTMVQAPIFGDRYALGDRNYTDFTFWWYWAQTDWSAGFKDSVSWADDAKFYYSTNLNVWSEYGAIKLASGLTLKKDFVENVCCGGYGLVGGTNYHFIGTNNDAGGKPVVYRSSDGTTFTNVSDAQMTTNQNMICYTIPINNILWVGTRGVGNSNVVLEYNGSSWTDHSAAIITAMTGSALKASNAIAVVATDIYLGAEDYANDRISLMKYSGGSWSELATWADGTTIFDMINFLGDICYLKGKTGGLVELRIWDVSTGSDALVQEFKNDVIHKYGGVNKYLHILNGKLIITIPYKEIWSYDEVTLKRIWKRDDVKNNIGIEASGYLYLGGVYHDNKIWWSNLMYDGSYFFNNKKDVVDSSTNGLLPVYTDKSYLRWRSGTDITKLYADDNYKGTADKNFLIFNQIDAVSTIDKLFYSCNLIFKKLVSGQKIIIEYSTDEMATWTSLGNVDYSVDGETVTNKTLYFTENTIYKKLWLKVELEGGGSDTPTLQDISIAYYPVPEYKQRWGLRVSCFDNLMLLDGKTKEPKRGEELRNLLKTVWKDKQSVEFQDVDFAETLLDGSLTASNTTVTVDSTNNFPEQGIIRIEKEKIKYTGRTATTFTGCTRGYEGTIATTHANDTVVSNSHKVIITRYEESIPVGAKAKINEFLVELQLMEI